MPLELGINEHEVPKEIRLVDTFVVDVRRRGGSGVCDVARQ